MDARSRVGVEAALGVLLLVLGLGPRLVLAFAYPVQPISDFAGIIQYALHMRDQSIVAPGYYWDVFNVGPPLVLSFLLRLFPHSPETTARLATAVFTGLMPLLPFLIWRRVLPLWVRTLAGAMLALWPGQVLFSSVVAQDNWVTPPTVALAALAARSLASRRGHPLAAGLLFALAVAMRQEMLYVLALPLLAAAGILGVPGNKARRLAVCALAVGLPFLNLATQRHEATGHFALGSGHLGYTLLGTVRPGATRLGWDDPVSYVAAVKPELVRDRERLFSETLPLAVAEVRRRPFFQGQRVLAGALRTPFTCDADNLYWSLTAPGAQQPARQAGAAALAARLGPLLLLELKAVHAFFLAALGIGAWKRNGAVLVVAAAALLKVLLHAALVPIGRFLVPAVALELLAIALGCWVVVDSRAWRAGVIATLAGVAAVVALAPAGEALTHHVQSHDPTDAQLTYRFSLTAEGDVHAGVLDCVVRQGRLTALGSYEAVLEPLHEQAPAGESAVAQCVLRDTRAGGEALALEIAAPAGAAAPGIVVQRVKLNGRDMLSHDVGDSEEDGWVDAPLGRVGAGPQFLRVETEVMQPAAASVARTRFRLVRDAGEHQPANPP